MDLELPQTQLEELSNEIVTVSFLQVALQAEAHSLQLLLNDAALRADTTTIEGLSALLQQVARALLDYSRCWTHVAANSQTLNTIAAGEALYNQLLNQERAKFSAETLTNVDGVINRQPPAIAPLQTADPTYYVISLLLGTADDQPLFGDVYSASVLRDALDEIRMMQPRYLMVFDVLWSPQDERDSLTEADLTAEYPILVRI